MKKTRYAAAVVVVGLGLIGMASAQHPDNDIDPHRHGNLAEAQRFVISAYGKIREAQKANNEELGGHGDKAIALLEQCNHELKEAAEYADHRH